MGHYGGRGTTAAAMVHRVFAIYKHGCCLLCYKCTDDFYMGTYFVFHPFLVFFILSKSQ